MTYKKIFFQELTCDVELQHPEPSKQQPLQFSFTLYDLDGHGRMTKDVSKSIYKYLNAYVLDLLTSDLRSLRLRLATTFRI